MQTLLLSAHACMDICVSSQQKNLVYTLRQEVPKLMYAFWTCKPVFWVLMGIQTKMDPQLGHWMETGGNWWMDGWGGEGQVNGKWGVLGRKKS